MLSPPLSRSDNQIQIIEPAELDLPEHLRFPFRLVDFLRIPPVLQWCVSHIEDPVFLLIQINAEYKV